MSKTNFHALTVKAIEPETQDAVVVTFDVPEALKADFQYIQGQYLTLRFDINSEDVRRAYSLCSSPVTDSSLSIGVKRVPGGKVSPHINDKLKVGDVVEVMPPQGRFYTKLGVDQKKDYFLFGGGSGITPLLSIAKSVLETEPKSRVLLYYANRNEDSIMFKAALEQLSTRYAGQLVVKHILDQPKTEKKGGFLGMFAKKVMDWKGEVGRLDATRIKQFIDENHTKDGRGCEYFVCGPGPMMRTVESALLSQNVDKKNLHVEWFTTEKAPATPKTASAAGGSVTAILRGEEITFELKGKESILEALRRLDKDPPFSCMSGACSTCMAKVIEGEVEMDACFALDDDEVKQGYVLTCTGRPKNGAVKLSFDDIG